MAFGFEIPSSVQPKDAAAAESASKGPTYADIAAPPQPQAAPGAGGGVESTLSVGDQPSARPQTFGDVFGEGTKNNLPNVSAPPTRDLEKISQDDDKELNAHVDRMAIHASADEASARDLAQEHDETQGLFDSIAKEMGNNPTPSSGMDPNAPPMQGAGMRDKLKYLWTRFRGGLTGGDEGMLTAVKSMYDANGQGGKVEVRDGNIWFRSKTGDKMRRFDPDAFEPLMDVFLDHSGAFLETGAAIATEGALAPVGEAAAGVMGAVRAGGAAVSAAAAGTAARAGTEAVVDQFSAEKQFDWDSTKKDLAWSMGINVATLGVVKGAKFSGSKVADAVRSFAETPSAEVRVKQLADIRTGFDKLVSDMGGNRTQTSAEVGRRIFGAVDDLGNRLSDTVMMMDSSLKQLARDKQITSVGVDNTMAKLRDVLRRNGVQFDKDGYGYLASQSDDAIGQLASRIDSSPANLVSSKPSSAAREQAAGALTAREGKAFNSEQGKAGRDRLVSDYNNMLNASKTDGGIPLEALLSNVRGYQEAGDFAARMSAPDAEISAYRELQHAAGSDRHDAISQIVNTETNPFSGAKEVMSGASEKQIYQRAYQQYAQKMDDVMEFRNIFSQRKSAEAFTSALTENMNSARIDKLKGLLGEGSPEFQVFKSEYLNKTVQNAVEPTTGIFQPAVFARQFKQIGKDSVNSMFGAEEQKAILQTVRAAERIKTSDLVTREDSDAIKQFILLGAGDTFKSTKLNILWNLVGRTSKRAADYLRDDLYLEAAKAAPTDEVRQSVLGGLAYYEEFLSKCTTVKVGGQERYVPTIRKPVAQGMQEAVKSATSSQMPESNPRSAIDSMLQVPDYAKQGSVLLQSGM
jgi:hypothetical protein